ncbi:unnamed protein product [Kuraishia capsulata CBS 1993]|uniref:DUF1746 domain-containing protein n=1 Tax=Kuraishia capsulata CBS 1993 TaxID=1382522 RepID=W6MIY4_9ASCO|nr:uncharacterized protein KUCA_T00000318001 [Kuraishia capsulata CBS 1993]CDK24357.1 unnamed protein product [Kuraishia capsulata CBS 1993]
MIKILLLSHCFLQVSYNFQISPNCHNSCFSLLRVALPHTLATSSSYQTATRPSSLTAILLCYFMNNPIYTMPGAFPAPYTYGVNSGDDGSMDQVNVMKVRKSRQMRYRKLFTDQLTLIILIQLVVGYFLDTSFFKLICGVAVELVLSNWESLSEWIVEAELIQARAAAESRESSAQPDIDDDSSSARRRICEHAHKSLGVYRLGILFEIVLLYAISLLDHILWGVPYITDTPKKDAGTLVTISWSWDWLSALFLRLRDSYNESSAQSSRHREDAKYLHGSLFVSLVGQLPVSGLLYVLVLDSVVFLLQLVQYQCVFGEEAVHDHDDGHRLGDTQPLLSEELDDGFQGSLTIIKLEMFPRISWRWLKEAMFKPQDPEPQVEEPEQRLGLA